MNKLEVKDLVSVGIFSALFIVFIVIVSILQIVPILSLGMPAMVALFTGPVYLLFVARTGKPLCISIMGLVVSLIIGLLFFGSVYIFLYNLAFFIIADIIASLGKYKSYTINLVSYIVLSLWVFGESGAYWVAQDWMLEKTVQSGYTAESANAIFTMATTTSLIIFIVITLIFATISGLVAKAMFKKHFKRAGIV